MRELCPAWPPVALRSTSTVRSPSDAPYTAAPLVVTLGQEAADVLAALVSADRVMLSPDAGYGRTLPVTVAGRHTEWLPLVHPGNRGGRWCRAHREWAEALV